MTDLNNQSIEKLLLQLSEELRTLNLWQEKSPNMCLLASQAPFCCDTLSFEQWLQFVFIPRLNAMIEAKQTLPTNIALCPMAEESFKHLGAKVKTLINIIADIDQLLSGQRQQTLFLQKNMANNG